MTTAISARATVAGAVPAGTLGARPRSAGAVRLGSAPVGPGSIGSAPQEVFAARVLRGECLSEDAWRGDGTDISGYVRAIGAAVDFALDEIAELPLILLSADHRARVVGMGGAPSVLRAMTDLGVDRGIVLGEREVGANAVGTTIENRTGMLVCGEEHAQPAFHRYCCYGQPVIHPITGCMAGVLVVSGEANREYGYFRLLARQIARDAQDRMHADSPAGHRRLLTAFRVAARGKGRAVLAVGDGLVLATPTALDLLTPEDHASVRAFADERGAVSRECADTMTLTSGTAVTLRKTPLEGGGALVELSVQRPRRNLVPAGRPAWPVLVVGEAGSGRTHTAREFVGADAEFHDAAQAAGGPRWADQVLQKLGCPGPDLVIENLQALPPDLSTVFARHTETTSRRVVFTSLPGSHLASEFAELTAACGTQRRLIPLRRRPQEVPQLAAAMLREIAPGREVRFTVDCLQLLAGQQWSGNLVELRRVVATAARRRTVGDLTVADLPESHRQRDGGMSPRERAEREAIVDAIEAAGGNKRRAALALGMSRATLYNRMRALRIDPVLSKAAAVAKAPVLPEMPVLSAGRARAGGLTVSSRLDSRRTIND